MSFLRATASLRRRDRRTRRLAGRCARELTVASLQLALRRGDRVGSLLGGSDRGTSPATTDPGEIASAREVGRMVSSVARALPWHPTCLRQALAAQRVLAHRGITSTLHLGVTGTTGAGAHAWVSVGEEVVVGDEQRAGHVPLAAFTRAPGGAGAGPTGR